MPELPARPDLDHLRHQARDLLRAARRDDAAALARVRAVSDRVVLASAQLAVAREHGFPSWAGLKLEVERRDVLNRRDPTRLAELLARHPEAATTRMENWADHRKGADVLGYLAMLRLDHRRLGLPRDLPGSDAAARALIDAGAPVDGHPGDQETPLITAASCGDVGVAEVLIAAGADLDATAAPDSGGVPGGTAVEHAAVFGMTEVLDLLVAAGARVDSPEMAADLSAWPPERLGPQCRLRSLVFAADHQRLEVVDRLVAAGTPVNEADADWQRLPLHVAAANGKPAGVRRLLAHGADPTLRDPRHLRTPLEWCERSGDGGPGHAEVAAVLLEQMEQRL
ncbi:ankyrin repeat domain-containing protein [Saccharothrix texasensis]|uniref:Ankyrin repeat protein n=1 Tax=Saccharothrix texasensis TaxID=103734 RepID=A0A3N1HJF6_9PSEU|nr:ankyrin repeat domain-containing protein [Saccharothrix texasensis]ROP42382.1 ankyrin repeat protein [Saccharothrix texasensis]